MPTLVPAPTAKGIRSEGLPPGERAPGLGLAATPEGRTTTLAQLRNGPFVLVFYPANFTPVCTSELSVFNELLPELSALGARVFGVSVDSLTTHNGFRKEMKLRFPLLSDFEPRGALARRYNVCRADDGICERALFVVDREGVIAWSHVSAMEVNPGADGVLRSLESLTGRIAADNVGAAEEARP